MEILHISYERMVLGIPHLREIVFCDDHLVYTRTSALYDEECGWRSEGWKAFTVDGQVLSWKDMDELKRIAEERNQKGWRIEWNPVYNPSMDDFRKESKL